MKKIIFIFFLLFLSGCTATYQLTLDDNKITEKLTLIETNSLLFDVKNDSGWALREIFESLTINDEFAEENYSIKSLNNDNQLGVEYYSNKTKKIINSSALNQCYINPQMTESENIVKINTGSDFKCYEYYNTLDTVKVIFKTNHKVISSNADIVEGNKYIWNITKDGNKQIEISYDKTVINKNSMTIIIISVIVVLVILSIYYFISVKRKNENQI